MKKDLLIYQFDTCFDCNGWFVAVRNAVSGVTAEHAAWRPEGSDNTIWESLTHITFYNNAYLQRFKGARYDTDSTDNDETFGQASQPSDEEWEAEVARFITVMNELRDLLRDADEAKFGESVPDRVDRKWWEVIADINAHNAYHAGQILLLRKMQGAWNPDRGVS